MIFDLGSLCIWAVEQWRYFNYCKQQARLRVAHSITIQQGTNILVETQNLCYVLVSFLFNSMIADSKGWDTIASIATRYELDGP
jgi:hypothetical protein